MILHVHLIFSNETLFFSVELVIKHNHNNHFSGSLYILHLSVPQLKPNTQKNYQLLGKLQITR